MTTIGKTFSKPAPPKSEKEGKVKKPEVSDGESSEEEKH